MIALARNFRLVPIVVFATASLFVLKTLGILLDGGFALGPDRSPPTSAPAARPPVRATAPTPQSKIAAVKPATTDILRQFNPSVRGPTRRSRARLVCHFRCPPRASPGVRRAAPRAPRSRG